MSRNVIIAASLPATPDKLFDMYLDAEAHAAFTGFPVTIAARAGAPFRAFNDMLSGTIIPNSAVEHERGANLERRRHPGVLFQSLFCRLAQRLITLTKFAQQRDLS
jgi:hypothetical protein